MMNICALSSVVEHLVYTEGVGGSKPSARRFSWIVVAILFFASMFSALAENPKLVYVIPIRDEIEASMSYIVRRGVKEAMEHKADALVLDMDTNGGRVDYTQDIIKSLSKFPHRDQTYTYVNTKAFSAGAFIASATKHIYMAPTGVIGALTPIVMVPGSGVEKMPEAVEEKMSSAIRALVRANAEQNGHNPKVFDAMVDRDQGLEIDGKIIVPKGKVLTLTSSEAVAKYGNPPKPLLSEGTIESLDKLVEQIGDTNVKVERLESTGLEKLARFITLISPFLIAAAFICGYIEFKTPGFGIFGIMAAIFALIFFFGHYVAGLSGYEDVLLFVLGTTLIFLELLLFPGTLILGISGFAIVLIAFLRSMIDIYPADPILPSAAQLQQPLANLGIAFLITLIIVLILAKILPKTSFYHQLVLQKTNPTPPPAETKDFKIGQTGKTLTLLRPIGVANFGSGPVDVITQGDYLPEKTNVKIIKIEGAKIIVEKA